MGNQMRSTPEKSEVRKVGNVRRNDAQNLPHHHLPSRREVGGGEQGRALAGEVGMDDLLSGLGSETIELPGQGQGAGPATPLHMLQPSCARAREGTGNCGKPGHILGVDIGNSGGLALVSRSGDLIDVETMPVLNDGPKGRPTVNGPLLAAIVKRWAPSTAYIELVGPRPGEGAVQGFSFGRARGLVEGVLAAEGVPARMVTAPAWKRAVNIPAGREGAKDLARAEACRRWPAMAERFAAKGSDGLAEAGLVAIGGMAREAMGR